MGDPNLTNCVFEARRLVLALLTAVVGLALIGASLARAQADASIVKATFLYRFASFVSWPASRAVDAPLVVCVMEDAGLRGQLERLVAGQRSAGRYFTIERLGRGEEIAGCDIAYLNADEDRVRQALRAAAGSPVLTVTDATLTPNIRGIIHFVTVDSRVRFYIDDHQASAHGLAIDSRLLALALSVRRRG